MLFGPPTPSLTYSERLASHDLQAAEIFEPGKSAGGARRRSDAVSSRRRRLSSDLIFIVRLAPAPSSLTYSERLASQDLQAAEIFEPGKSAGGARGRSDAVSSRRRRLSSDLIFIVRLAPAPSSLHIASV